MLLSQGSQRKRKKRKRRNEISEIKGFPLMNIDFQIFFTFLRDFLFF